MEKELTFLPINIADKPLNHAWTSNSVKARYVFDFHRTRAALNKIIPMGTDAIRCPTVHNKGCLNEIQGIED